MAQHKVYRLTDGNLVVDLQSDSLSTTTRLVAPLVPRDASAMPLRGAEPVIAFDGVPHVLYVTLTTAVLESTLHTVIGEVSAEGYTIPRAIDMVFTGV
jgi:toxin CcdB